MKKWQEELQRSIRSVDDLSRVVSLPDADRQRLSRILERYPMSVTPYYLSLIDFADENDPIRKMAIPSRLEEACEGSFDTSGEEDNTVVRGLQHKYDQTVLLLSTNVCATYCRHCFRKRLVGLPDEGSVNDLEEVKNYLLAHPEITNILVSGGDALMNSNERLMAILEMARGVPQIDFIRIASRVPVTLPFRITHDPELLALLENYNKQKQLYLVTQFNHPREITAESTAAVKAVMDRGIPVRNQSVLLRGVNDDYRVLGELLSGLVSIGVAPYYLFQCRPVKGVKNHFQVPLKEGYEIIEAAKSLQSGLGKAFHYCMSHVSGKIEIFGLLDDERMIFKYHEAKYSTDKSRLFVQKIESDQTWLD